MRTGNVLTSFFLAAALLLSPSARPALADGEASADLPQAMAEHAARLQCEQKVRDLQQQLDKLGKPRPVSAPTPPPAPTPGMSRSQAERAARLACEQRARDLQRALDEARKPKLPVAGQKWTNSIGMEFAPIPAGTFMMGCDKATDDNPWCEDDAMPRHRVTITKPFLLGKYMVTQKQWRAVMGNSGTDTGFKGPNFPVSVSWNDIQKFIGKLNAKEGHKRYRLPTEAEWEYAARAGTTWPYVFKGWYGNGYEGENVYAWCGYADMGYIKLGGYTTLHPVGQKKPNPWGLYDILGINFEWTADHHGKYSAKAVVDPKGPSKGEERVLRGGVPEVDCAPVYHRMSMVPDHDMFGFRLAISPEP